MEILDQYLVDYPCQQNLLELRASLLINLGRNGEASASIEKLGRQRSQAVMRLKAWNACQQGSVAEAQSIWKESKGYHYIPPIQRSKPDELIKLDRKEVKVSKESILLFTAIKNERWRLPWFLSYYRSLGVDLFFFVLNDSDDGSSEFLREQDDVVLFRSSQPFAQTYAGVRWFNTLIERYGDECWCMYADVDEAIIFPNIETRGLRTLTDYMSTQGHQVFTGFMLDMVSPTLKSLTFSEDYTRFFDDYPFFENNYTSMPSETCPFHVTSGGVRRQFETMENLTKTPIIRGGIGIEFLQSSHKVSPAVVSDVSGAVLHFKLAGNFDEYLSSEITQSTRSMGCKVRHLTYQRWLEKFMTSSEKKLERLTRFKSSQQLVELGLIRTSKNFELQSKDNCL